MLYFGLTKSLKKIICIECIIQGLAHVNRYVQLKSTSKIIIVMMIIIIIIITIKGFIPTLAVATARLP